MPVSGHFVPRSSVDCGERESQRDLGAGDRRGARSAVGLQHVAVDPDRALAELRHIRHGPQRAADDALDFVRAPADAAFGRFALRALLRRARKHRVLGGHPAQAAALKPMRNALFDRRGAEHARVPDRDQRAAFGVFKVSGLDRHRP